MEGPRTRLSGSSRIDSKSSGTPVARKTTNPPITPESLVMLRPRKRRRSSSPTSQSPAPSKRSSSATLLAVSPIRKQPQTSLPDSALLLGLPMVLSVPPNHKDYIASFQISIAALKLCCSLESLPPDVECRAWTALAEIGLKAIRAGWTNSTYFPWAQSLELDVEMAIGKGLLIAQQSSSLSVYKQNLSLLHARLAHYQQNFKQSRSLLKRLSSSFILPTSASNSFESSHTAPWLIYTTHLTSIAHALSSAPPDLAGAFAALQMCHNVAESLGDSRVQLLTYVLRLRTLVDAGMWDAVGDSLALAESALGLVYDKLNTVDKGKRKEQSIDEKKKEEFISFDDPLESAMAIHVLIMGVVYYTNAGKSREGSSRLSHLHALLDSDALALFPNGVIDISLSSGPPLTIKCTHPRVLYHLTYLVSSVSKRDAVGRRPKRKVFASEGLNIWEKEMRKEVMLLPWADPQDVDEIDERMVKIKADLLSELVAVCIMRSEFEDAAHHLSALIAHTRTYDLFSAYAARITLHHAHFAHAMGDVSRARKCYAVAASLAQEGTFVNVSARTGLFLLRIAIGEWSGGTMSLELEREVSSLVEACKGMGGTLEAMGHVLQACVSPEILSAKQHLKCALDLASRAQDNHLRALVLALVSALYLHTAESYARAMLETCGQLASGLGAVIQQPNNTNKTRETTKARESVPSSATNMDKESLNDQPLGNVPLGLWIGLRFLELYKREGAELKVQKQEMMNARFIGAIGQMKKQRRVLLAGTD